jgi:hypothetical protein
MEHDKRGLGGGRPAKGSAKPPRGGRKRDTSAMGNMMARLSLSLSLSLTLARMTPTLALALALTQPGNMLQYDGVTGKGSRAPAGASSSLPYGVPGSLNNVAYMSTQPQPMSRLLLPSAKVRPDGLT